LNSKDAHLARNEWAQSSWLAGRYLRFCVSREFQAETAEFETHFENDFEIQLIP
jgi:hypothetical protein